ncbi:MAG: hypothetical protein KY462_03845 [Actinobacteria bacterium]|nr:hypothetical protein [Actinomycetota bacterium]
MLDLAADHAAHGWSPATTKKVRRAINEVLADLPAGRTIHASQVTAALNASDLPAGHTLRMLDQVAPLEDDRTPALVAWFDRQIAGLPARMADELRLWFTVLHQGHTTPPCTRPRSPTTIKTRLRWAMPTLRGWAAAGHTSLREISRADIAAALPPSGNPRATLGVALRSIFATLKAHKVIFTNPVTRTDIGQFERRQPLPADLDQIRDALGSADPARAAIAALVAFHGLRSAELCRLHLTDSLDRRLHLDQRTIPLAAPVTVRVAAYLDHRNRRWPNTANPHLFVTSRSALGTGPAGPTGSGAPWACPPCAAPGAHPRRGRRYPRRRAPARRPVQRHHAHRQPLRRRRHRPSRPQRIETTPTIGKDSTLAVVVLAAHRGLGCRRHARGGCTRRQPRPRRPAETAPAGARLPGALP